MNRKTRLVFFSACLGMLLFGIALITLGSVATPLRHKLALSEVTAGTLFSILPFGILLGSLLFGPFADRYGYKVILVLSCLLMFAGFQGIAHANSVNVLRLSVFLFGFGGGVINGATNASVADISTGNKGANISLIGVFFAIGALGMPVILGTLKEQLSFETIVSGVGYFTLGVAFAFMWARFPGPKQSAKVPFTEGIALLKDPTILLIGMFLFCQSSFEAIINNWTTTYLSDVLHIPSDKALYALSLYVAGMAVMRLLAGSVFRNLSSHSLLAVSFVFLFAGIVLLRFAAGYGFAVAGLISLGVGLASGFPVMLGLVGSLYARLSATAFSIVLTLALLGNMLINFLMGVVAQAYGVVHLPTVAFAEFGLMAILSWAILQKTKP